MGIGNGKKLDSHLKNFITSQLENPKESYGEITERILSLFLEAEASVFEHRKKKMGGEITDDDFKDMYLVKSILYNILLILGWDEIDK
jgi:hypothetical protein